MATYHILRLALLPIAFFSVFAHPALAAPISGLNAYDTQILDDMNSARVSAGLPPLKENLALDRVAKDKLQDIEASGTFAHIGSDGRMSWHWFISDGYRYLYAGENLAKDFPKATDAFNAYMASPTHRANILNPHYTDVGLASGAIYEAVEFGSTP